ncbi:MAG TPA: LytTR family transcriptional regulator DNA-binding domain-containing protein [Saprospiraceae bacterium]|nr:LytTR family transcriptional regulator DNA-binding domain-containing protein [Saprospiraceae bacterium]
MKSVYTVIIIDDELLALKRLKRLMEKHVESFEILAEAYNGEEGLKLIEQHKPDLIFLDIEMPGMNGFEMLNKLEYLPKIIFTTAFDEYAIKAFEENSIDYLLKPIELERLDKAVEKLKRLSGVETEALPLQLNKLIAELKVKKVVKSIPVKIGDKILLIKPEQISYLEAKDKYVFIVTDENKEYLTDFTLTSLEEKLSLPFLRVHRAFMINCDKIKEIHKGFNGSFSLIMKDSNKTKIQTGRSYNDNVKGIFEL